MQRVKSDGKSGVYGPLTVVRSQTAAIAQEIGGVDGTTTNAKAVAAANLTTAQTAKKGLDAYTGAKAATGAP